MLFEDRRDAGRRLAARLMPLAGQDVVVVGLPRGGVPVAFEVAQALDAPLDVVVVRKLGVPYQPEYGMGAVGDGGVRVLDEKVVRMAGVSERQLTEVEKRERDEVNRRAHRFRGGRRPVPLQGRTVIVVDDGIATGSTARAACQVARARGAARVVLAVPVGPEEVDRRLRPDADEVICLSTPRRFFAIGQFYRDFAQTSDEAVVELLRRADKGRQPSATTAGRPLGGRDEEVTLPVGQGQLAGHLTVPDEAPGIVVFAHGSGSSRHSPRNRYVAAELNAAGLATLLVDLLTVAEEADRENVFDIDLLAGRLLELTSWVHCTQGLRDLHVGFFGASTGAGAALRAAADPRCRVAAIVCRGGRPDLAGPSLGAVRAPTLLIVGGLDDLVIDLNRRAQSRLTCENRLELVPGATHLFEEAGALEQVARSATDWFTTHLTPVAGSG